MTGVSLSQIVVSLTIVAAGGIGAYALYFLFQWIGRKADRGRFQIDGILLRIFGPPISVMVALVSVNYALYRIPQVREQFSQWEGAHRAVFILTGTWILASLVKNLIREYGLPLAAQTDTEVDERIIRLIDLTAVYVIWIVGILIALRELGIQVTAFLASMGIAGLAIALAAKTVLSNVLAGVTLTADPNFRVGDRIEVGEHVGDVLSINLHKTVIRTRNNEIVMIPNDVLGREVIVNHMLPEQKTRIDLEIDVAYDTDLEQATTILQDIIEGRERILSVPAPEVNVRHLGDNAVTLRVLMWIDGPRGKRAVRDDVYRRALSQFRKENVEIPFPQRVVQINDSSRNPGDVAQA